MKASIKFRDDDRPLMRAKVPIGVLGLPFQSGLAVGGDPRELRFDLSTAFASGPALRLSYRPNDPGLPFALTVRAGLGALGSPHRAPFALAAEFNLLSSDPSSPAFFLRLKPRLGDFSLAHTLRSSSDATTSPAPRKVGDAAADGEGREQEFGSRPFAFTGGSGLAAGVAAAGTRSGVGALLSGMRLTTRSVLPLWGRASMRFNWGLRVPPDLLADGGGGGRKAARAPVSTMPLLVMSKVCIEQSPRAEKGGGAAPPRRADVSGDDDSSGDGGAAAFSLVRRQLESLNVDSMLLRRAVEDLRAEIRSGSGRAAPLAARGEGRVAATAQAPPQPYHALKPDRPRPRGAAREPAAEKAAAPDDVSEELKKALEARLR